MPVCEGDVPQRNEAENAFWDCIYVKWRYNLRLIRTESVPQSRHPINIRYAKLSREVEVIDLGSDGLREWSTDSLSPQALKLLLRTPKVFRFRTFGCGCRTRSRI